MYKGLPLWARPYRTHMGPMRFRSIASSHSRFRSFAPSRYVEDTTALMELHTRIQKHEIAFILSLYKRLANIETVIEKHVC